MSKVEPYIKAEIRADSGEIFDKGNWGVDPCHPDFNTAGKDIRKGLVDTREFFVAADAFAITYGLRIAPSPGTYLISSNLTLSSPLQLRPGTKLKPANGVTITLLGAVEALKQKIFDTSAGGSIAFGVDTCFPEWWGAAGDAATDDATPINASIAAAGAATSASAGGNVEFARKEYLTLSSVIGASGVRMRGQGGCGNTANLTGLGATRITGKHAGVAVLDMRYCAGMGITGIGFYGHATTPPNTGVLLGRPVSTASSGNHSFQDFQVSGYFTVAALYSVASENNIYWNTQLILNGGGATKVYYTGQADGFSVGGLTGGTNIDIKFFGLVIVSYVNDGSGSLIYIDAGQNTKSHSFFGGYISGTDGNYVTIRLWETDNQPTPGPITFVGMSGERTSGTNMRNGFNITSSSASALSGLTIIGCVFPTIASTGRFIKQSANATLKDLLVKVPAQNAVSDWVAAQLANAQIDEGFGTTPIRYGAERVIGAVQQSRSVLTDASTVAVDASLGNYFVLSAAAGRTIGVPTNAVDGQSLDVTILNNTVGAITTTWSSSSGGFSLAGAWTDPATTKRRSISFRYDSTLSRWMEVARTAADI